MPQLQPLRWNCNESPAKAKIMKVIMVAQLEQTSNMLNHFLRGESNEEAFKPPWWDHTFYITTFWRHYFYRQFIPFCEFPNFNFICVSWVWSMCRTRKIRQQRKNTTYLSREYIPSFLLTFSSQLSLYTCQLAHLEKHLSQSSFAKQIWKPHILNYQFIQIAEYNKAILLYLSNH